ncbi:MAG: hypothetical protein ABW106_15970 [Steroidobacteraceae bacterium]
MRRRILWLGAGMLCVASAALGIEAPKPQPAAPAAQPEPARAAIAASDETAFYQVLQRVSHRRNFTGLIISNEVIDALARGDADVAVNTLSSQANNGKLPENIALVRLQHWCNRTFNARPADTQAQIKSLPATLSSDRAGRAAGVLIAEEKYRERARASCGKAQFDFSAIESRLRAAADGGDPASATELAQFVRDPKQREALLQSAVDKNFAPAVYTLATSRLMAVQRGETTENVASIRLLLKQAGRTMPKAKIDLANCMALGCDGHPADAATAQAFGLDAARDGEPTAFLSIVRMPWARRMTRVQMLSWQYFGDRLNEAGCGGDAYVSASVAFDQSIQALEKSQDAKLNEQAKAEAETLWQQSGERARREQGCSSS